MKFDTPNPLKLEHEELHEILFRGTKEEGGTGEAAKAVAAVLHPHFEKEEELAMPPLGLLAPLSKGEITREMESILEKTDRLKAELPQMLQEHKEIVSALKNLIDAAKKEKKPEYLKFSEKLILHAQTEEEVLYPAAILVGEFLKMKLHGSPGIDPKQRARKG